VKQSGALAASARPRLLRAWGRLDEGAAKKKGKLELCATAPGYSAKAQCSDPSGGWFDICGHADYEPGQRDVYVSWSPTPDCNGE